MNDIQSRKDIELLVNSFYDSAKVDPLIGPIFSDIAKVNWEHHLPVMYSFWETMLLGSGTFEGNPMQKHVALSKITPMNQEHFDAWKAIWIDTVDANFEGGKANEAKQRARSIADLMLHKISLS